MKKYKNIFILFSLLTFLIIASCNNETAIIESKTIVKSKTKKLTDEIFKNGNFLSGETCPKLIFAEELYTSKENDLIIDLRTAKDFSAGHIKNAVNIKSSELIDFAQVKGLPQYNKVVLVCYTGQSASFSTAILQLLGYNNVYALKWGMCSWNPKFSDRWVNNVSDHGLSKTINKDVPKNDSLSQPIIEHPLYSGPEILYARSRAVLDEGYGNVGVKLNYLEAYAKQSYIISYETEAEYKNSHLKNSVHYSPINSLNISTDLLTLPANKTIIIYSNDAHQSAFIAAYLKVLGYDAKNLKYGATGFMNSKMLKLGFGFSTSEVKDYPYETSEYIEVEGAVQVGGC